MSLRAPHAAAAGSWRAPSSCATLSGDADRGPGRGGRTLHHTGGRRGMQIGMVGLGRMGANMAARLQRGGHAVVAFDPSAEALRAATGAGATAADSLPALVAQLAAPRAVWVMVPAGDATEATVRELAGLLAPGDVVIDGGNSNYKDSVRRAGALAAQGLHLVDVGTSGGVWGLREGYSLMIG